MKYDETMIVWHSEQRNPKFRVESQCQLVLAVKRHGYTGSDSELPPGTGSAGTGVTMPLGPAIDAMQMSVDSPAPCRKL